ncbi:MAG: hypothetical protein O2895_06105 [Chloroflexi bacterium]|nr:hypothetical protein [Chloroflexota bacterium]
MQIGVGLRGADISARLASLGRLMNLVAEVRAGGVKRPLTRSCLG